MATAEKDVSVSIGDRKCRFHPEVVAKVFCNKLEYGYCESCLESCAACTDPELYCRHRTQCIIWELCRKTIKTRNASVSCRAEP
jgi:hypothetical protein